MIKSFRNIQLPDSCPICKNMKLSIDYENRHSEVTCKKDEQPTVLNGVCDDFEVHPEYTKELKTYMSDKGIEQTVMEWMLENYFKPIDFLAAMERFLEKYEVKDAKDTAFWIKTSSRGPFRMGEKMVFACVHGKDWSVDKWRP